VERTKEIDIRLDDLREWRGLLMDYQPPLVGLQSADPAFVWSVWEVFRSCAAAAPETAAVEAEATVTAAAASATSAVDVVAAGMAASVTAAAAAAAAAMKSEEQ
jgi:hypothetical protein